MFIQRVKYYHQWLRTAIHFKTNSGQIPSDSVRIQGPSKRPSSGHLYPVSSVKERNRKGGKCKISRVLQSPVSSPQASPKVEATHRLVHLPPIQTDCKGSEANGPLQRTETSPIPGRLADQVPVSGESPSEHSGSSRPNPVLGVDNKSGEIRTKTNSGVFVRGLRIPSRFSPCKTHSREMAKTSGFDPTTQVKTCFDCKMFDISNWVACLNEENVPGRTPSHEALSVSSRSDFDL